jgi:hypothetical protein
MSAKLLVTQPWALHTTSTRTNSGKTEEQFNSEGRINVLMYVQMYVCVPKSDYDHVHMYQVHLWEGSLEQFTLGESTL